MDEGSRRLRAEQMEQEYQPFVAYDPSFKTDQPLADQDFGDFEIDREVTVQETGKTARLTENAQQAWNDVQDRKTRLEQLLECLNA